MAISYEVDRERGRVRTRIEGPVTTADVADHVERFVREGLIGLPDLIDAREARGPGWFGADVRKAADLVTTVSEAGAFGPRAIVVSSTAAFGMVRMLSVLVASRVRLEAFRELAAAEQWLEASAASSKP